jgi:hypothetical protein
MKTCTDCDTPKPHDEFHKNRSAPDGLCGICRACAKSRKAAHYLLHRKEIIRKVCAWSKRNRPKKRKHSARWQKSVKGRNWINFKARESRRLLKDSYVTWQARQTRSTFKETKNRILKHRTKRALVFLNATAQIQKR